jgi:hypothetical protein
LPFIFFWRLYSIVLQITASDYLFYIFKPFLHIEIESSLDYVMLNLLVGSTEHRVLAPQSVNVKDYGIDICFFPHLCPHH